MTNTPSPDAGAGAGTGAAAEPAAAGIHRRKILGTALAVGTVGPLGLAARASAADRSGGAGP
ncbi:MAG: deferrochelatase/peroxidase EfeB, partial [Catenulispora sp.]|nr:deferrochelatase/peroxidase EfeB [Catenulispora sp.]